MHFENIIKTLKEGKYDQLSFVGPIMFLSHFYRFLIQIHALYNRNKLTIKGLNNDYNRCISGWEISTSNGIVLTIYRMPGERATR